MNKIVKDKESVFGRLAALHRAMGEDARLRYSSTGTREGAAAVWRASPRDLESPSP